MATPRSKGKGGKSRFQGALKGVITAAGQTSRQRNSVQLSLDIQFIETVAKESGLPANCFSKIIDVAASRKFAETVSSKLIRCLIPETVVPQDAVLKAISWMCTNIPSVNTQALLIRWINLIFDYIDGKDKLHALYGIIFYFLDSSVLMPHVCYLLYQLTQREDVRMFRVRHLLKLQAAAGSQPYLMGLLSLYKLFYPNLVTIAIPRQRMVLFRSVDVQWAAAIRRVREKNRSLEEVHVDMDTSRLRANKSLTSSVRPSKRVRLEIPAVSTNVDVQAKPEAEALVLPFHRTPMPFSHIKDFAEMVENLERIEMPGQIAALLQNPLLQHVVSCQHSRTTAARFSMWLQHALLEEFINSPDVTAVKQKEQLLHLIIKYSNFLQEGIPACERFLEKYLMTWNGQDYKRHIFELISRYRMCPFGRLKETLLEPLRCLFFSSSVYFKCQVLVSLTSLLRNYCLVEWRRCLNPQPEGDSSLQEEGTVASRKYMSLFEEGVEEFLPRDTIQRLIQYVDRICCIALLVEEDNILLMNYVLSFYELVCQLPKYDIPVICLPSRSIVYRMLLGASAMSTSRICGLLCSYKTAFDQMKSSMQQLKITEEESGLSQIEDLNVYIMDFATSLWQYKAFQSSHPTSAFNFDPDLIEALSIPHPSACFSIHSHQSLLGFVLQFLEKTQPAGTLVHPNSIKASQNTKQIYLKFLQKAHLHGIVQFVATFIRRKARRDTSKEASTMIMEEG